VTLARWGSLLALLALAGVAVVGASPAVGTSATGSTFTADAGVGMVLTSDGGPVAECTVSDTSVQTGEEVTIDASGSENADDYQYDKYGDDSFGDYTSERSRTVAYGEVGTYEPQVKVWSYSGGEEADTATCGTVTVTEPTPTPTPTPTPDPVADCTVSDTSVQVDETVTIDASASENVDDYQYDKYGNSAFGDFIQQETQTVSYGEVGTYEPRVKVWGGPQSETSDTATCGTVTVTESTPTPTPTPTPDPVADCTVSDTSVQTGEEVTIDASGSRNVDDYQYDKYGGTYFGDFTQQETQTVSYGEVGTYNPRVKVWGGPQSETSDTATCGTVTVTESTPTPTPTGELKPSCDTPDSTVSVNESVLIDARDSMGVERYEFARDTDAPFGAPTSASLTSVEYREPGTYGPRLRVTGPDGDTEIVSCGQVTVEAGTDTSTATATTRVGSTVTPTATAVPTAVPDAIPTAAATARPSAGTPDQAPAVNATLTAAFRNETTTPGETWFEYDPREPDRNDSVQLVARPAVARNAVEAYSWDLDGDGTADRRGRTLELAGTASGETAVTLVVERADGSTASVTREVPVAALTDETGDAEQVATTATAGDGDVPILALLGLLVVVLVVLAVARSQLDR
jgi:hypothetical protein